MGHPATLEVLAIAPHPDDAEMCCGGTLARMVQLGHRAGILDLSRGELASNGTVAQRAQEAAAAAKILGLTSRENLGLPDGFIAPDREQVTSLVTALRRLRPELVLAPYTAARHPDHEAAAALARKALFLAGVRGFETFSADGTKQPRYSPRQVMLYEWRFAFPTPTIVVDTTDAATLKAQAIACYGSQVKRDGDVVGTLANAPLNVSAGVARDRYRGAMIGCEHGEAFVTDAVVGLRDPLAHFRQQDFVPLFFPEKR